jgi:hypothetical protein
VPTKTLAATAPATKRVTPFKRVTNRDPRALSAWKIRITGIAIADIIILSDQLRIINPTITTAYDLRIELKYAAQNEPRMMDTQVLECNTTYLGIYFQRPRFPSTAGTSRELANGLELRTRRWQ